MEAQAFTVPGPPSVTGIGVEPIPLLAYETSPTPLWAAPCRSYILSASMDFCQPRNLPLLQVPENLLCSTPLANPLAAVAPVASSRGRGRLPAGW